ncbi:MAG: hypothetical protein DRQ40_03090 [Gammaproteobacteria bacterium]|nr:MAG: hypothetical protein DRQ40_03090 [Gammaproteobacteria bacterium]
MRYFTNSELDTMRRCPRKWYFSQYLSIYRQREVVNEAMYTGTLAHAAIAELYNKGNDPLAEITLMAATDRAENETALIDANDGARAIIEQNLERIGASEELAIIMVTGYLEWLNEEGPDEFLTFISAEEELNIVIPSEQIQEIKPVALLGKLDARFIDERSGARVFMDHKTVQNFPDREKWAHLDPQFLYYGLIEYLTLQGEQEVDPDAVPWTDGGIINMLRKVKRSARAKPPFYKRKEVRHSQHELRNFYIRTVGEVLRILQIEMQLDSGLDHHLACPPSPTSNCSWDCPYLQLCPMTDDGSDVSGFIEDAFKVGDPIERYVSIEDAE